MISISRFAVITLIASLSHLSPAMAKDNTFNSHLTVRDDTAESKTQYGSEVGAAATFESQAHDAFASAVAQYNIPGLIVGVTQNGHHRFYATGLASRADNRPVTPDTLFELGSISKLFTVTLAALAEQRGQLSLDAKASDYLCKRACSIGNDVTLMDLATHYSGGLPLQVPDKITSTEQLIGWLKTWQAPQPGKRSYSNVSIGLLGHITAGAMGMPYTQALHTVLLPELGLTDTWIDVPTEAMSRYAYGYDRKTDQPIRVSPGVLATEAYGVKSTAKDMLKFLDVVLGRGDLSAPLKAAVNRTKEGQLKTAAFTQDMVWEQYPWPANVETMKAGNDSAFILNPQPVEKINPPLAPQNDVILNKTGSTNGFGGYVAVIPSQNLGIVVLANRNFPNEARVTSTYALINTLLNR